METQIAEFTKTEAALATLETKYSSVPDATTEDGYNACVEAIRELRPLRTGLDKMRLKLNSDDQARIKFRNAEAKRINSRLVALEDPIKTAKQAIDDKAEREAEEARQKEQSRIEDITGRIARIKELAKLPPYEDSTYIKSVINDVTAVDLASFEEYEDQARSACAETMLVLHNALKARLEFESQQVEQARIAKEQAEKQAELDAQAEKQRQAAIAAKKQAETDKALKAEREKAEKLRQEKEKLETEKREAEAAEKAKQEAEEEIAKQNALRPEKDRLIDWAKKLNFIDGVELKDKKLVAIQSDALGNLSKMAKMIISSVEKL